MDHCASSGQAILAASRPSLDGRSHAQTQLARTVLTTHIYSADYGRGRSLTRKKSLPLRSRARAEYRSHMSAGRPHLKDLPRIQATFSLFVDDVTWQPTCPPGCGCLSRRFRNWRRRSAKAVCSGRAAAILHSRRRGVELCSHRRESGGRTVRISSVDLGGRRSRHGRRWPFLRCRCRSRRCRSWTWCPRRGP